MDDRRGRARGRTMAVLGMVALLGGLLSGCLAGPTLDVVSIAAGRVHSCMARADGTLYCWGDGAGYKLGDGTTNSARSGVQVVGIATAVQVAVGQDHSCALLGDGTAVCWGENWNGQLGDGTTTQRQAPVAVSGLMDATELVAGDQHTCARLSDATVRCWGANGDGQIGDGTTTMRTVPTVSGALSLVVDIAAAGNNTCVTRTNFVVRCWGDNTYGQIGDGTTVDRSLPTRVTGLTGTAAMQVAVGPDHACAISAGSAWCWGDNGGGELGDGTTTDSLTYVAVVGLADAAGIAAGLEHTCATRSGGSVSCWGNNSYGQMGDVDVALGAQVLSPAGDVTGLAGATAISGGRYHSCAVYGTGRARCWGSNDNGQLGDGTLDTQVDGTAVIGYKPGVVGGALPLGGITSLSTGGTSCAVLAAGTATCWGDGQVGRLGDGSNLTATPTSRTTALFPVTGLTGVTQIESGGCAIASGAVHCWGHGLYGALGDASTGPGFQGTRDVPFPVVGLTDDLPATSTHPAIDVPTGIVATDIAIGGGTRCAVLDQPRFFYDGVDLYDTGDPDIDTLYSSNVACWGYGNEGQVGDGHAGTIADVPVGVIGITDAVQVAAGGGHGCALRSGGTVECWGHNDYGELGDGTTDGNWDNLARPVSGLTDAVEIGVGDGFSCALRAGGTVVCWGRNADGQLGDGTTVDRLAPTTVISITTAVELDLGAATACVRLADTTVSCWGNNFWSLVLNPAAGWPTQPTPLTTTGLTGVASVDLGGSGASTVCVVLTDQTAKCWGWNGAGNIGDGTRSSSPASPQKVITKVVE